jgi:hypothetical protein
MILFVVNSMNKELYDNFFQKALNQKHDLIYKVLYVDLAYMSSFTDKKLSHYFFILKKEHPKIKICYLNTTYLLHEYMSYFNIISKTNINIVRLITCIKIYINVNNAIVNFLRKQKECYIIAEDLAYNNTRHLHALMHFIGYEAYKNILSIKPPVISYQNIQNWNTIYEQLSKTELHKFLK